MGWCLVIKTAATNRVSAFKIAMKSVVAKVRKTNSNLSGKLNPISVTYHKERVTGMSYKIIDILFKTFSGRLGFGILVKIFPCFDGVWEKNYFRTSQF